MNKVNTAGANPVASEEPLNPYRDGPQMAEPNRNGPHHPAATGLDGQAIDQLMMARFTEGAELGRSEERIRAAKRFAEIFDEGQRAGLQRGARVGAQTVAERLAPLLSHCHDVFEFIANKTGSEELRNTAKAMAASINDSAAILGTPLQGEDSPEAPDEFHNGE